MIHEIEADNVNEAFFEACWLFRGEANTIKEETRNGPALVLCQPLVTTLRRPTERVLFLPKRDANPFFHLMEGIWMLAGRNDVAWVEQFVKRMRSFSDDGKTLAGAYGYRWVNFFGFDQLQMIVDLLRNDPGTRRAVLAMWSPEADLAQQGKDVCCNLTVTFDIREGRLNAYINNRSNDVIWGLLGANAVHFSMLLEYVAGCLQVPVGRMTTFSVNAHMYEKLDGLGELLRLPELQNRYAGIYGLSPYPMFTTGVSKMDFDEDIRLFMGNALTRATAEYHTPFFAEVVSPIWQTWITKQFAGNAAALVVAQQIRADDWRIAITSWLERRVAKELEKEGESDALQ